jgi:membrane-associated protease RseP (regulator of RpoE activity)
VHVLLFVLTLGTATIAGIQYYGSFASDIGRHAARFTLWHGLWYALPVLLILGAHEMGHYVFCRRYKVDASLPYFIPAPIGFTGTFGAVIRIREAFPTRAALFDIGVAGPIAGFVALLPFLIWGLALSKVVVLPKGVAQIAFGEPLLFKIASWTIFGSIPDGQSLNAHPMVFAAWFGMLATALNLLPFGQLDGGHIAYAALGRYSTPVSVATAATAVIMTFVSTSWLLFTVIILVMLLAFGPTHPRVINEHEEIGRGRQLIAILAIAMLVLCFTPVPIEFLR